MPPWLLLPSWPDGSLVAPLPLPPLLSSRHSVPHLSSLPLACPLTTCRPACPQESRPTHATTSFIEHFVVVGLHPRADLREVEEAFAHAKSREAETGAAGGAGGGGGGRAGVGGGSKAAPAPAVALEPQVGGCSGYKLHEMDTHESAMCMCILRQAKAERDAQFIGSFPQ